MMISLEELKQRLSRSKPVINPPEPQEGFQGYRPPDAVRADEALARADDWVAERDRKRAARRQK